jgi:hypothetical protein
MKLARKQNALAAEVAGADTGADAVETAADAAVVDAAAIAGIVETEATAGSASSLF